MAIHTLAWDENPPAASRGVQRRSAISMASTGAMQPSWPSCAGRRALAGPAVALSFDPHPLQLLRPKQFQPVLTAVADRGLLLQACGADHVLFLRTSADLLHLSAAAFFHQVLHERLDVRALVEGPNFRFGRNREGNLETLTSLCREIGIGLTILPPVSVEGRPVSSSRVRMALERGAVREAAHLLDRPYRLRGNGRHRPAKRKTARFSYG